MVKKSNIKIPAIVVIRLIVFLFIGIILFWIYSKTSDFVFNDNMFDIKDIKVDQSISFIDAKLLTGLKGQNIFSVDLNKIHQRISNQYPQISQLRVMRQLPDSIIVLAKKRDIFFQVQAHNKILIVDTEGVTMFYTAQPMAFPMVIGVPLQRSKVTLGLPSTIKEISIACELLKQLKAHEHTSRLKVISMQVSNLSKIEMTVMPNIQLIIDQDDLVQKVEMLEFLFQNGKINWNNVKYIDVRFKEPIINETIPKDEK